MKNRLIKILLCIAMLCLICSMFGCGSCGGNKKDTDDTNDEKQEQIKYDDIEIPEGETILDVPEVPNEPDKPIIDTEDISGVPYISKVASTTEAYVLNTKTTTNGDKTAVSSVDISFDNETKTLDDWNYLYFDIPNYNKEYSYVRFDLSEINGAEKIAVSAVYYESYGAGKTADENLPAVGILVENLMDGAMSFVANLSSFKTVDRNYNQKEENLIDKTICRLKVYIDTNPSQSPSDKTGSLTISGISFLKADDPNIKVDNSPKVGEISAVNGGYTISYPTGSVFKVEYQNNTLSETQYVSVKVDRFVSAYGTIKVEYVSNGLENIRVTNQDGEILSFTDDSVSKTLTYDIRGMKKLTELRFYLDNFSPTKNDTNRSFEVKSIKFVYTPYVDESWSATSNFWIDDDSSALGGKIKASYQYGVGYDSLNVNVKHWNTDFGTMVVKFKLSGSKGAGITERYGMSINSQKMNAKLEVKDHKISELDFDSETEEYALIVDLSDVNKISTLNFYFDSIDVAEFSGTRTVEFTSITFINTADGESIDYDVKLSAMTTPSTNVYTFTHNAEGDDTVSWTDKTEQWAKAIVSVSRFNALKYAQIKVTLNAEKAVQVGLCRGHKADYLVDQTNIPAGETTWIISIADKTATIGDFGSSFDLVFYFNAGSNTPTTNTVNVKIEFLTEAVETKPVVSKGNKDYMTGDTTTVIDGDTVTWTTAKSQWDAVKYTVSGYDSKYKCMKVSMTPSVNCSVGIIGYVSSELWFKGHTEITGETTWYIDLSTFALAENFELRIYYNALETYKGKAGSVTITFDFLTEMPSE